jgi:putative transcriptional regulator
MADGNFERAVVFVIEHSQAGAVGLVLNKPLEDHLGNAMPVWNNSVFAESRLFCGGPVDTHSSMALGKFIDRSDDSESLLFADIGVIDLGSGPESIPDSVVDLRPFVGYSGWSSMQLEAELSANAWFVVDVHPDDIFTTDGADLWSQVLRRQKSSISWLSNYPRDPRMN